MDQQGLARLIALWAMREPETGIPTELDPAALVHDVSKLIGDRLDEPDDSSAIARRPSPFGCDSRSSRCLGRPWSATS